MITENVGTLKIQKLTQEQFDREKAAGRIDETSIYVTEEEEVELARRLSEIDKADWVEDEVPQEWIDTEIASGSFPNSSYKGYTKTKGSGYAYDFGRVWNRVYIERSGNGWNGHGGGQYNKYALTMNPSPVPDPDYKDWDVVKDETGNIVSMTPKSFNDSIPMRLKDGHIRVPKNVSTYDALTGDARLMAATSVGYVDAKDAEVKAYVDEKFASSENLTEAQATQVATINSTNASFDGTYTSLTGKPAIPTTLSQLTQSASYRTVTDTEKAAWNAKSNFSGSYNDLTDIPAPPTFSSISVLTGSTNVTQGVYALYVRHILIESQGFIPLGIWIPSEGTAPQTYYVNYPTSTDDSGSDYCHVKIGGGLSSRTITYEKDRTVINKPSWIWDLMIIKIL